LRFHAVFFCWHFGTNENENEIVERRAAREQMCEKNPLKGAWTAHTSEATARSLDAMWLDENALLLAREGIYA
jgi:hypothetical protein